MQDTAAQLARVETTLNHTLDVTLKEVRCRRCTAHAAAKPSRSRARMA
jgi:hypothetical protein